MDFHVFAGQKVGHQVIDIALRFNITPMQVIFKFSVQLGILPLTGTTNPIHMVEDLDILKFEVLKNMSLTLLVAVFSIFMGVLISYILSSVVNPNAFGWQVPLTIFPDYWLKITIVGLIISMVTSCLSLGLTYRNKKLNMKASYQ